MTALSAKADSGGFLAVYPSALGDPAKWDVAGDSDIKFIETLLERLVREPCLDRNRVFATGISMGAGMANIVGCRLSDRIAAIATVSGVYGPNWGDPCRPSRPVPVLAFHGLADPIVPYAGGPIEDPEQGQIADLPPVIAVEKWAANWASVNGCDPEPKPQPPIGEVQPLFWLGCHAPVRLYKIGGGGHTWPGGPSNEPMTNYDVSATDMIWDFFSAVR
jgi:polyhydroxybutyrate depolymerase